MSPAFRSMLWKEWRERRTLFFICLACMIAIGVSSIEFERHYRFHAALGDFFVMTSIFGVFAAIFLGIRTAQSERTDRTRAMSDALPFSAEARSWVRIGGGAAALLFPIAIGAAIVGLGLAGDWIEQGALDDVSMTATQKDLPDRETLIPLDALRKLAIVSSVAGLFTTGLYLLVALCGTKLRTESHAGYAGAAIGAAWFLTVTSGSVLIINGVAAHTTACIGAFLPQTLIMVQSGGSKGSYHDIGIIPNALAAIVVNIVIQAFLAWLFVRCYSRHSSTLERESADNRMAQGSTPAMRGFHTRGASFAWLSLRQAVPMCLPGLVFVALLTIFDGIDDAQIMPSYSQVALHLLPHSTAIAGMLWAVVVGAGLFASELDSRTSEFLMTRPIRFQRLFWIKLTLGILAVLMVVDGPGVAASVHSPMMGTTGMDWSFIMTIGPIHVALFGWAVGCACFLRRPAIGGMFAIGAALGAVFFAELTGISLDPMAAYSYTRKDVSLAELFSTPQYQAFAIVMGTIAVSSALVAQWSLARFRPGVRSA